MPAFNDQIKRIVDGMAVNAANANAPLDTLLSNILYLKGLIEDSLNSEALYIRNAPFDTSLLVGQPVYFNHATGNYEKALADGSAKESFVGFVFSKTTPAMGDIVTLGYVELALTNALDGESLAAGRYFLSPTDAGIVTATQPDTVSVMTCISDGAGNLFVLPQIRDFRGPQGWQGRRGFQSYRGPQGPQGSQGRRGLQGTGERGYQGFRGYQGYTGPGQPALYADNGPTGDAYAEVAVFGPMSNGSAFLGTLKNTGGASLTVSETVTDMFGITDEVVTAIDPNGTMAISGAATKNTAYPPFTSYSLKVKSTAVGVPSSYTFRFIRYTG